MRLKIVWLPAALAAFATLSALPGRAQAQDRATMGREYSERRGTDAVEVTFFTDNLQADSMGATGDVIRRPPGVVRVGLLRPRLTFVPSS